MLADLEIEEASALAETLPPAPPEVQLAPALIAWQRESCDSLWLAPCPVCSWVALWRRPSLDVLDVPHFALAQHTTARYGRKHYMLRGCAHATDVGLKAGPVVNRMKVAVTWRRRAAEMRDTMFHGKMTPAYREAFLSRLGHISLIPPYE